MLEGYCSTRNEYLIREEWNYGNEGSAGIDFT